MAFLHGVLTGLCHCRLLIQDGTGEAHLYVKDRVLPVALGMSKTEWADLLDLVHTVGQVSYTKSSLFKVQSFTSEASLFLVSRIIRAKSKTSLPIS